MIFINTVDDKRFSLNGIEYLKNYITAVRGIRIQIFNCYENADVLLPLTVFSQVNLDGVVYSNVASLQSAILGVTYSRNSLGGENAPIINQDNIDIAKRYFSYTNLTAQQLATLVNNDVSFVVSEIQSLWIFLSVPSSGFNLATVYKYKVFNKGKGTYGTGGNVVLSGLDLQLTYVTPVTAEDVDPDDPTTQTINYPNLDGQTISEWLNEQDPSITIQPQDEGYTLFKGTVDYIEQSYLWVGAPGAYGVGNLQSTDADFQLLSDVPPGGVPNLQEVTNSDNTTTNDIVHENESGTVYKGPDGNFAKFVFHDEFEISLTKPTVTINTKYVPLIFRVNGQNDQISDNNGVVDLNVPSGETDLYVFPRPENVVIGSSTGDPAIIPLADTTNAGLINPAEKTKLNNTSGTNSGDNAANTTSNAYADGKVQNNVNSSTTVAPSTTAIVNYVNGRIVAFQPETKMYTDRMADVGNILDYQTTLALDDFVTTTKRDGGFSKIKFWAPLLGYNLAGALVKFVVDAGGAISMVNTGLTDANYNISKGLFVLENQTTRYFFNTGFNPSANGLSSDNLFFGYFVSNYDLVSSTNSSHLFSDAPVSGDSTLAGTANGAMIIGTRSQTLSFSGKRQQLANALSSTYFSAYLNGENQTNDRAIAATAVTLNTEVTVFKSRRNGNDLWMRNAGISYLIAGSGLTNAQAASMNKALYKLYERLGRIQTQGSLFVYFGDSNTAGISAATGADRFSVLASAALGGIEYNLGVPSSQLRQTVTSLGITGGYQRYQSMLNKEMNTLVIMYGTNDMNVGDGTTNGDATIIADFRTKLQEIVVAAKAKGIRVILITPPYNTISNTTKQLAYNAAVALVAKNTGVPLVDAYRLFADKTNPLDFYASDGLHLNTPGHLALFKLLVSVVNGKAYREVNIDLPSIPSGGTTSVNVTMPNIVQYQTVVANYPSWTAAGLTYRAESTADDIATITVYNNTNTAIDATTTFGRIEANLN
ncbi:hypothetical protein Q765_03325 [Flavobacterium rivuli WB 3.3-2 = DSM 21788]|uniref:SGNH hydrolase-type esterase domain-containing protein n=1 Tax=Flavobacterium rivuli WB 3.3-2 = DSM 21788 TaxID=1121895 RepID=A0A0A2M743_9FLAO|nr:SGNH/GDSL hydrolase family protein [Flavobacterium rivuli]KGO88099.1 hypothetical protein Q765_03325 [Flavobacterium rivuli WB 3.3-2 = DSM 21788]